jgi:hypothetical protein
MAVTLNASTSTGLVQSADTSGEIELQSNGTTALKVNTNEGIQILNCLGVGNATPSTSGAGITFPATQSASSDANTLDDYEEGTWTPTWGGSTVNPTVTYDVNRFGKYTKIGNVVYISARVGISTTAGGSGNAEIRGLPFTVSNDNAFPAFPLGYKTNFNTNGPDYARFNSNSTYATVWVDANTNESALTISNLQNGLDCLFTGFYYTS